MRSSALATAHLRLRVEGIARVGHAPLSDYRGRNRRTVQRRDVRRCRQLVSAHNIYSRAAILSGRWFAAAGAVKPRGCFEFGAGKRSRLK